MKSINDLINEAKSQVVSAGDGNATVTAAATTLWLMAEMTLDWLNKPNKSADFYKGDGGQTVTIETKNIESLCKELIDKADDLQNS